MLSKKTREALKFTEEQEQIYKSLERNERVLKACLYDCNVSSKIIEKIIAAADLSNVDPENTEALKEDIKEKWKDFIINKGE